MHVVLSLLRLPLARFLRPTLVDSGSTLVGNDVDHASEGSP